MNEMPANCFTLNDLLSYFDRSSIESAIKDCIEDKKIEKIHDNLYAVLDTQTGFSLADDRFVIASKLYSDSYITHHTAFEYYGCYNQVYNWVYTSGKEEYLPFVYNGYEYHYISANISCGVIEMPNGIKVTDIERTVLDSIKDFDFIDGLEEVLKCIELLPALNEEKIIEYLNIYNNPFLYKKTGYILENYKELLHLSSAFFSECHCHISPELEHLSVLDCKNLCSNHNKHWQILAPKNLYLVTGKGVENYYDEL